MIIAPSLGRLQFNQAGTVNLGMYLLLTPAGRIARAGGRLAVYASLKAATDMMKHGYRVAYVPWGYAGVCAEFPAPGGSEP